MIGAVFDCMLWVQASARPSGPARRCFEMVLSGDVRLFLSDDSVVEIKEVLSRFGLRKKSPNLDPHWASNFLRTADQQCKHFAQVPKWFALPRDKKDEPYIDLAITAAADFLVTWNDRHLTYMMRQDTPEGRDFCNRFPKLRIVDPPTFLREVAERIG